MIRATHDHNSGEGQMRSFFERWSRIEDVKQAAAEDSKQLFAEAKAVGFNTKAMRAVFRDKAQLENEDGSGRANREEFETICELYRAALDAPRAHPARTREIIEQNSSLSPSRAADTAGEVAPPASPAPIQESVAAVSGSVTPLAARGADESAAPIHDDIPEFLRKAEVFQ